MCELTWGACFFYSMRGIVIKSTGSWHQVQTEDGRVLDCKLRGNYRLKDIRTTNPLAVGDKVIIEGSEGIPLITSICDRKNYIIRKSSNLSKQAHVIAANIDQAFFIATVNYPITSTTFIDRFLATAEAYRIPVCLLFNKVDRYEEQDLQTLQYLLDLYQAIGYPCFPVSFQNDTDLQQLEKILQGKVTLLSGHSGVGKSTFVNRILPQAEQKTAAISEYHNKGMHTTTFSEMIALPFGGYLVDTPGIKGFGVVDMESNEVSHFFPEIFSYSRACRFNNCMHLEEPGCAVHKAVEKGEIAGSRYASYLSILNDKDEGKYRES